MSNLLALHIQARTLDLPPHEAVAPKARVIDKDAPAEWADSQRNDDVALELTVNGAKHSVEADPQSPLLWVLRDHLKLVGTKYGCGMAQCSACTVLLDGAPTWSCQLTAGDAAGHEITTVEGLAQDNELSAVQQAWVEEDVAQCGYCQAGQMLTATELLRRTPSPTDEQIDAAMDRNVCRCGTYIRIRKAIHLAAAKIKAGAKA